jgi:hypothetical protein
LQALDVNPHASLHSGPLTFNLLLEGQPLPLSEVPIPSPLLSR